jgi:hypothetical protein
MSRSFSEFLSCLLLMPGQAAQAHFVVVVENPRVNEVRSRQTDHSRNSFDRTASLLTKQYRGIDPQRALRRNPRRDQSERRHRENYRTERQRIAGSCLIDARCGSLELRGAILPQIRTPAA